MATENMIKFLRGNVASLPQTATPGAVYFTKDEGLYLGLEDGSYHRYGDFIIVANVAALPASGAHETCMYYCESENILAKWDGEKKDWVQINKQQTLAQLGGVAQSVYEAKMAALEKADTDNATAISGVDTRLQAAEKKLESVATTEGLGELAETVAGHTTAIDTINGDVNTAGSMLKIAKDAADAKDASIKAAQDAADKAQGDVDALAGTHATDKAALEGAIALKANIADVYNKGDIDGKVEAINGSIALKANSADVYTKDEVDSMVDTLEAADLAINNLIGDVTEGKTVVEMIEAAQTAATYNDTEVRGLISDNADAIAKEVEDREGAISDLQEELEGQIATKVEQSAYNTKVAALVAEDERLAGLIEANETAIANEVTNRGTAISGLKTELEGKIDLKADQTALEKEISDRETAVSGLQTQINTIMNNPDAEGAINSINEFTAWVSEHGTIAEGMRTDINANAKAIEDEAKRAGEAESALSGRLDTLEAIEHDAYIAADTALKNELNAEIAKKAAQTDLDAMGTRVGNLETASATHATKTEVQAVSDALTEYKNAHSGDYNNEAVDAKVKAVQDQIDALNDTYATDAELEAAISGEITRANGAYAEKALETTVATHVNNGDIHVTTEDKEKWNGAQAAAEATAAAALATARTEVTAEIATAKGEAIADAEGKIATAKSNLEGQIATAKSEAISDAEGKIATAKSDLQGNIDGVSTALNTYKTENNAAVALKADASSVYTKTEVEAMLTWGEF